MVFVELTPFVAFRDEYRTDEDLHALQSLTPQQVKVLAELMKGLKDG